MKYLILAILILINTDIIFAKCNASLEQSSLLVNLDSNIKTQQFSLIIKNVNRGQCGELKIISESNLTQRNLTSNSQSIPMNIYTDSSIQNILPLRSFNQNGYSIESSKNNRIFLNLFSHIETILDTTNIKAADYKYTESLSLYDSDSNFLDRIEITFVLNIPLELDIKLVNPGTNTHVGDSLSFKRIDQGESVEVDTIVNSNIGYSIWIESDNSGKLKHETLDNDISYKILKNNQNIGQLNGQSYELHASDSQANSSGDRINLKFQIDQDVSKKPAGEYLDVIRINIQSEM